MSGLDVADPLLTLPIASLRLLALFTTAPVFGHGAVAVRIRTAFALVVAWSLAPALAIEPAAGALGWAGLVLGELLVGLTLGFAVRLVFAAFDLFGEFVSIQGGLGAASVVDPSSGASSLALASAFQAFMLLVFVAIDGHHDVLRAAALSYEVLPVGAGGPASLAFLDVVRLASGIFEIAVRLAAPVTVAMMLSNVAMGILGRAIPQLNLMMLQLPAHVVMTLGLLMLGAGSLIRASEQWITIWPTQVVNALVAGR